MTIARTKTDEGYWVARGFDPIDDQGNVVDLGNDRDSLVYGTYKPSYATTGVIEGTELTPYNAPSVDTFTLPTTGGVIENKIIYGDMSPPSNGAYWEFRNCKIVGGNHVPTSGSAMVVAYASRTGSTATTFTNTGRLRFIDCTFEPRRPSLNRDGITGFGFTLERCLITGGCIDCVGAFITTNKGTHCNVKIYGCLLEKTGYYYPDYTNGVSGATNHTDGTHNDLIQAQGGDNLEVIGNFLDATSYGYISGSQSYPDYPWMIDQGIGTGACILLQNNTGASNYTTANTKVTNNWLRGGKFQAVFHDNTGAVYTGNQHYRFIASSGSSQTSGHNYNGWHGWVSSPSTSNIVGLQSNNTTNVTYDNPSAGQALVQGTINGVNGYTWRVSNWSSGNNGY